MRSLALLGTLLGTLLAGCDYTGPQVVTGTLTVDATPLASGDIRLITGEHPDCSNATLSAAVTDGRFELRRTVEYGGIDVIIQEDALCIRDGVNWIKAWHSVYGPASETLTFACQKQNMSAWSCTGNGMESHFK